MNTSIASTNRYKELSESIPAYKNLTDVEETIHATSSNVRKRPTPKIRKLTPEEIQNVKAGRPSKPSSPMCTLYFEGIRRNKPTEIKACFYSWNIPLRSIRNISFIGSHVMELLTFEDARCNIIDTLAKNDITYLPNFNPLSISNLKNNTKFGHVKTDEEKQALVQKLYKVRLQKTFERLPQDGRNNRLRNYIRSRMDHSNTTNTCTTSTTSNTTTVTMDKPTESTFTISDGSNVVHLIHPDVQANSDTYDASTSELSDVDIVVPNHKRNRSEAMSEGSSTETKRRHE